MQQQQEVPANQLKNTGQFEDLYYHHCLQCDPLLLVQESRNGFVLKLKKTQMLREEVITSAPQEDPPSLGVGGNTRHHSSTKFTRRKI